jgi:DNA replication and repair protein RecF
MIVEHLELVDFRNYPALSIALHRGTTAVIGDNGHGKTNLVEALGYLASLSSFRGVPNDVLVRHGADAAVVRASVRQDDGRETLIEARIAGGGRSVVQVNRQRLRRARDLLGTIRVTVFSPDDLELVKGGPGARRRYLDDVLISLAVKYDALRLDLDRIVTQRNRLLKQAGRVLSPEIASTLDVWDERFASVGEQFGHARAALVERLTPHVRSAYDELAGDVTPMELRYDPTWRATGLAVALESARAEDVRRGVSTVGPHRDDLVISLRGLPSRTHASQGEQRTLALALRLAAHRLVAERTGAAPLLVLDDVLSELDHGRAVALLAALPAGQVVITSATPLPSDARADWSIRVVDGTAVPSSS